MRPRLPKKVVFKGISGKLCICRTRDKSLTTCLHSCHLHFSSWYNGPISSSPVPIKPYRCFTWHLMASWAHFPPVAKLTNSQNSPFVLFDFWYLWTWGETWWRFRAETMFYLWEGWVYRWMRCSEWDAWQRRLTGNVSLAWVPDPGTLFSPH